MLAKGGEQKSGAGKPESEGGGHGDEGVEAGPADGEHGGGSESDPDEAWVPASPLAQGFPREFPVSRPLQEGFADDDASEEQEHGPDSFADMSPSEFKVLLGDAEWKFGDGIDVPNGVIVVKVFEVEDEEPATDEKANGETDQQGLEEVAAAPDRFSAEWRRLWSESNEIPCQAREEREEEIEGGGGAEEHRGACYETEDDEMLAAS